MVTKPNPRMGEAWRAQFEYPRHLVLYGNPEKEEVIFSLPCRCETGAGKLGDKVREDDLVLDCCHLCSLFSWEKRSSVVKRGHTSDVSCSCISHCRESSWAPRGPELWMVLADGFITLSPLLWAVSTSVGSLCMVSGCVPSHLRPDPSAQHRAWCQAWSLVSIIKHSWPLMHCNAVTWCRVPQGDIAKGVEMRDNYFFRESFFDIVFDINGWITYIGNWGIREEKKCIKTETWNISFM